MKRKHTNAFRGDDAPAAKIRRVAVRVEVPIRRRAHEHDASPIRELAGSARLRKSFPIQSKYINGTYIPAWRRLGLQLSHATQSASTSNTTPPLLNPKHSLSASEADITFSEIVDTIEMRESAETHDSTEPSDCVDSEDSLEVQQRLEVLDTEETPVALTPPPKTTLGNELAEAEQEHGGVEQNVDSGIEVDMSSVDKLPSEEQEVIILPRTRPRTQRISYAQPTYSDTSDVETQEDGAVDDDLSASSDFAASIATTSTDDQDPEDVMQSDDDSDMLASSEDDGIAEDPVSQPKEPTKRTRHATAAPKLRGGLNLNLPPMSDVHAIFDDMTSRALALGLEESAKALDGRPLNVATMCSGTESPLAALELVSESLVKRGHPALKIQHQFSAEIDSFRQSFIERNYHPKLLFRDVRDFIPKDATHATTAYGADQEIPGLIDLLIAGFVCKDLSSLNSHQKALEDGGESGDTWAAVRSYVERFKPSVVLIENVRNTVKFWNGFEAKWNAIGYASAWHICDTKNYYIPQTRLRMYMIAVNKDLHGPGALKTVSLWKDTMVKLQRQCSSPFLDFLHTDASEQSGANARVSEISWDLCRLRNDQVRSEERLGAKRPVTHWTESGSVHPPDIADHKWYRNQPSRVCDAIDIASLKAAKAGYDASKKMAVWDVSQNVDRFGKAPFGIIPCITPSGCDFVTNRQSSLSGSQMLLMQGMPMEKLILGKESQKELQDLAGNAMTTTVIGASIISSLIHARQSFRPASNARQALATLKRGPQANELVATTMLDRTVKAPKVSDIDTNLLLREAKRSAQLCSCEKTKHVSKADIHICKECQHTCCSDCLGNPRHNFVSFMPRNARLSPADFERTWRRCLPARLTLKRIPDVLTLFSDPDATSERSSAYTELFAGVHEQNFSITSFCRLNRTWRIAYEASFATLELVIGDALEWNLKLKCPPSRPANDPLRIIVKSAVARAVVESSLLDARWQIFLPQPRKCVMSITGSDERLSSFRSRLGLPDFADESVPKSLTVAGTPYNSAPMNLAGIYNHLPVCGTAMSSLYKKSGGSSVYLFLESDPITPGTMDGFVFSEDSRDLLPSLVSSFEKGRLESSWRPWNTRASAIPVQATIPGSWVSSSLKLGLARAFTTCSASDMDSLTQANTDCSHAVVVLDVKTPETIDITSFSSYAWVFQHAKYLPTFRSWMRYDSISDNECDCNPMHPQIRWSVEKNVATAREDKKSAAEFERGIKTRPAIVDIRPTVFPQGTCIQVGLNVKSLIHRAKSRLGDYAALRSYNSWRLIDDHIDTSSRDVCSDFVLRENSNEPYSGPLNLQYPLLETQLRSLAWMMNQEAGTLHTITEVEEEISPDLGWRVEGRAQTDVLVQGGVLADLPSFGKTVTTIGLIHAEFSSHSPSAIVEENLTAPGLPRLIDLPATLIVCPTHIAKQWREEFKTFLGPTQFDQYNILLIERLGDLQKLSIEDFQNSRVIIVSWKLLGNDQYISRQSQFAAMPEPATTKNRAFDSWLEYVTRLMPSRIAKLKRTGVAAFQQTLKGDTADRLAHPDFQGVVPLKVLHGSAYQSFAQEKKSAAVTPSSKKRTEVVHLVASPDEAESDWQSCTCPVLSMFRYNRIVIDEYHYLYEKDKENYPAYIALRKMSAHKRWVLSGTPALANFTDINHLASLLGTTLGRDVFGGHSTATQLEKRMMADMTDVERFLSRTETKSVQWHEDRHQRAQVFLDRFVRQNRPELKDVACIELLKSTELGLAHHAVYLELSQHLICHKMQVRKLNDRSKSDRVERLNASLSNSASAEDALIKSALVFCSEKNYSGLDMLERTRTAQIAETEAAIRKILEEAEYNQRRCKSREPHYLSFKSDVANSSIHGDEDTRTILSRVVREAMTGPRTEKTKTSKVDYIGKIKALTSDLRWATQELTVTIRSLRFIKAIQRLLPALAAKHGKLASFRCDSPLCEKRSSKTSQILVNSNCGHIACESCLMSRASTDSCIYPGCDGSTQATPLIKASELGSGADDSVNKKFGEKMQAIHELLHNLPADDQAVVFVPNEDAMDAIEVAFKHFGISYYAVSKGQSDGADKIEKFKNDVGPTKKKVLVLNQLDETASGTNLVNANHVIFVSPLAAESQYKYESAMAQAIHRCRRYRQKKTVHAYHFVALRTIDVDIMEQRHKRFDVLYDTEDHNYSRRQSKMQAKTKMVRNAAGNIMLVPVDWLLNKKRCAQLQLEDEQESFCSLIRYSEGFAGRGH